jgi:parvulin-like peptidyl-prolyl isomerase
MATKKEPEKRKQTEDARKSGASGSGKGRSDPSKPPWSRDGEEEEKDEEEEEDEEDEDEEEEDEEDEDEEEEDDQEDEDEEEEDEEDEDEEEEDDQEDEDEPRTSSSRRARSESAKAEQEEDDWLPDWAPWAVMIGLVGVGTLGALGVFAEHKAGEPTAADVAVSAAPATSRAPGRKPSPRSRGPQGETISASHVLVAYQGAKRASSAVTRTKEEARQRAQEVAAKAKKGEDFAQLVAQYSDERNAAARKGNLGRFTRRSMVKPFSDAAFALKPGEVSDVVETPFGFHVIRRHE